MNEQWTDAAPSDLVPAGEAVGIAVSDREVALYNIDGDFYATDNFCTHGHARLCEGYLEGHEIECPLHQGRSMFARARPCAPP